MTTEYLNNKVLESNIARFKKAKQDKIKYELILDDLTNSQKKNKNLVRENLFFKNKKEYNQVLIDYNDSYGQLAVAFLTLAENIIRYRRFHFVDTEDAVQEFTLTCLDKIDRFDPRRGSKAFNFFSTVVINSYRQMYRSARNYNELKRKYGNYLEKTTNTKKKKVENL